MKKIFNNLQNVKRAVFRLLIRFMEMENSNLPNGIVIAVLMFLCALFYSTFLHRMLFLLTELLIKIRSALSAAIYRKTLFISPSIREKYSAGEVVNLITVDIQRIEQFFHDSWILWNAPFQILIGTTLLWGELGPVALIGLAIMFVSTLFNAAISRILKTFNVCKHSPNIKFLCALINLSIFKIKFSLRFLLKLHTGRAGPRAGPGWARRLGPEILR